MWDEYEIFRNHYDRYIEHYKTKGEDSVITAYAELTTTRQGIQQRIDDYMEFINREIEELEEGLSFKCRFENTGLENIGDKASEIDPEESKKRKEQKEEIIQLVRWAVENRNMFTLESTLNKASKLIHKFYDNIDGEGDFLALPLRHLDSIIRIEKKLKTIETQLNAIKSVTSKIIDQDYPSPSDINYFDDLADEEKKIVRNEEAQKMVSRGEDIDKHYDQKIKNEAQKIIDENWEDCITPNGNASSYFFNAVHRRLEPVEKEKEIIDTPGATTVRNRINELLEEGKIKPGND